MLETKKKQTLIKKFAIHDGDTGSSEVQIAILTAEIDELIKHLKTHSKDHSSRRGLLRKVSTRRRLMKYLKKDNPESFEELSKKLKIKQARLAKNPRQVGAGKDEEPVEEEVLIANDDEAQPEQKK